MRSLRLLLLPSPGNAFFPEAELFLTCLISKSLCQRIKLSKHLGSSSRSSFPLAQNVSLQT